MRPVVVGEPPSGLVAPAWWGEPEGVEARPRDPMRPGRTVQRGARYAGATLTGEALALVGVTPPLVDPDQVVLFRVTAEA